MTTTKRNMLALLAVVVWSCGGDAPPQDTAGVELYRFENTRPVPSLASMAPGDGRSDEVTPSEETDPCPCTPGESRCEGESIQTCFASGNDDTCGIWSAAEECSSPQAVCTDGECSVPDGCLDRDGDGYGSGCAAGQDCDDTDASRFAGNPEVCDAKDNDCDGAVDEGLDCSTTESICSSDVNEPNESLDSATNLVLRQPVFGAICAGEYDFFKLDTIPGSSHRLHLMYPEATSDVNLRLYENGQVVHLASTAESDQEVISFVPSAGASYHAEVVSAGNVDNVYRLTVLDSVACAQEDAFAPNHSVADAAPLVEGQRLQAQLCTGTDDWYFLGHLAFGERITVQMSDRTPGDGDLDIELYADENGDGQATLVDLSYGLLTDEVLSITVSASPQGPYLLKIFGYGADAYEVDWTRR